MYCTFEIYNGSSPQPIMLLSDLPCLENARDDDNAQLFYDVPGANNPESSPLGRNYVKITKDKINDTYGEYQLVLKKVEYVLCNGTTAQFATYDGVSDDRICTMNFAVSDGFMLHQ